MFDKSIMYEFLRALFVLFLFCCIDITVFSVDPGNVETNVFRHFPFCTNKFLFALQKPIRWVLVKTPKQGAQTVVHVVCSSLCTGALFTGSYYSDCKINTPSKLALDNYIADNLWNNSLEWCGLTFDLNN